MNKLFITAFLSLVSFKVFATVLESKSDAQTLFLVTQIKDNCEKEFMQAIEKGLKIIDIVRLEDSIQGKSQIVTVMQTGFYAHPLTGPKPQIFRVLKMSQLQMDGPIPADRGPFYQTSCELIDLTAKSISSIKN